MSWDIGPNMLPAASLGRRFLALALDWIMCRLIAGLLTPAVFEGNTFTTLIIFYFTTLIIFYLEVTFFTIAFQASAGQRLMAIKVVGYPEQQRISPVKVALRTLLICLVLPAVFTNNQRPLHDHFTQSMTVREI